MSLAQRLIPLVADAPSPHGRNPQLKPPKPRTRTAKPPKNSAPKPPMPIKNKPKKTTTQKSPVRAKKPQAKHGLFHHLGQHVAKWWHSLTHGQRHAYAQVHPRSPITRAHKGKVVPRNVDHAQAKEYHDAAANFHHNRAQTNAKKGNTNLAAQHAKEARRHRANATRHANKIK